MGLALPPGLLAVNVAVVTVHTTVYAYGHSSYSFWVSTAVASIPGCWALYLLYLWIAAAAKLVTARRLASLHITIDASGVTVGQHLHRWKWIRHIVLTPARTPNIRTLLVDAHTSSEANPKHATRSSRIRRRRILGTRTFTVELPMNSWWSRSASAATSWTRRPARCSMSASRSRVSLAAWPGVGAAANRGPGAVVAEPGHPSVD